ncbi:MAG: glycosyltransferase family 4 protein [Chloroflexi bacterium]|nr:glycosyltransferase family 4 protein [Chloroflexota bacterium]
MKILVALTYYRPHVSGLTIYVERLSRALARRGHAVTVLTSHYEPSLPLNEMMDGVRVVRAPVLARVSKGVLMPTLTFLATKYMWQNDALSLHLPQLDASGIATRAKLLNKPSILTYHSDLLLPPSFVNRVASTVVNASNHAAAKLCDAISAYTDDFAKHSPYLSKYLHKVRVIAPPVEIPEPDEEEVHGFVERYGLHGKTVLGLAGRFAAEKGIEYLLEALPGIMTKYPNVVVVHAGPREAIGESAYLRKLEPLLEKYRDHYVHVGTLNAKGMAAFFKACHVTTLPSINSTETFGLVQIESMMCGTPVVASDLPGVRQPTTMTGMGRVASICDSVALAEAILDVLDHREKYLRPRAEIADVFSPDAVAARYEALFEELKHRRN